MYKKTLLSLAVASSITLTGCDIGSTQSGDDEVAQDPNPQGLTWPLFNPGASQLPVPSDLNFDSDQGDGTFGIDVPEGDTTIVPALNELSGASTVAPVVVQTNGTLDPDTVKGSMMRVTSTETGDPDVEVTPIGMQTVFLIELEYASGDPVQGLGNNEPSKVITSQKPYIADVESLDGQSAIRILPVEPLDPRKRYVVVVTNEVSDINGDPITQSPTYEYLSREAPVTAPLIPVQSLINGLWEPKAVEFFAEAGRSDLTESDVALSFSITTSNDEKVLQYIAEPGAWFSDQLQTFTKVSATAEAETFAAAQAMATGAATAWPDIPTGNVDAQGNPILFRTALANLFGESAPCDRPGTEQNPELTGQAAFDCAGITLASGLIGQELLPTPVPAVNRFTTDFDFDPESYQTVEALSPAAAGFVSAPGNVLSAQGTISLPYYLSNEDPGVVEDSWVADDAVATAINDILEGADLERLFVQENPETSTAVNYIFPFPKKQIDVDAPFLALYPSSGELKGVVIYQHGITTDRSTALSFGTALANQGYAVFAIDHPLHGVAAEGSTFPGLDPQIGNERHFGLYAPIPGGPIQQMDFEENVGDSGSLFINLSSFLTSRDNNRQSVVDKMNLRASLAAGTSAETALVLPRGNNTPAVITAASEVFFAGHSLGTITGTPFVASVNENQVDNIMFTPQGPIPSSINDIKAASLLTPGGGIVRLLENSEQYAKRILFGLSQDPVNLSQGDAFLELYFNVYQAVFDTADPVNFVGNLAAQSTPTLLLLAEGDTVIPNAADKNVWGIPALEGIFDYELNENLTVQVPVNSFSAPLAGSLPLAVPFDSGCLIEYATETGVTHGTPASADPAAVFGQMVASTVTLFTLKDATCPSAP